MSNKIFTEEEIAILSEHNVLLFFISQTNAIAEKLNEATFEKCDYLKLFYLEQSGRLRI